MYINKITFKTIKCARCGTPLRKRASHKKYVEKYSKHKLNWSMVDGKLVCYACKTPTERVIFGTKYKNHSLTKASFVRAVNKDPSIFPEYISDYKGNSNYGSWCDLRHSGEMTEAWKAWALKQAT